MTQTADTLAAALRAAALRYPETTEGVACEGTAIEKRTIKVRNKAFLFLGKGDVMLKLRDSAEEAAKLATEQPGRFKLGANGWATAKFSPEEPPPVELLTRWIDESYRLLAPKALVARLE